MAKNEKNWFSNYEVLKAYIIQRVHLPDKHVIENRALLPWALYQRKKNKEGLLNEDKVLLFDEFTRMRSSEHTGSRKKLLAREVTSYRSQNDCLRRYACA